MPILGVPENKVEDRAGFFEDAARLVAKAPSFSSLALNIDPFAFRVASEAYFFLNSAYKKQRILDGSKTMLPKVAAMTAIAIGQIKPIRPPSLTIDQVEYLYINGALAMRLCCSVMKCQFQNHPFDSRRRWYRFTQNFGTYICV